MWSRSTRKGPAERDTGGQRRVKAPGHYSSRTSDPATLTKMSEVLYLDTETYSSIPLKDGVHKYSEAVEVMIVAYALDDGPVNVWDVTSGEPMPEALSQALADESVMVWAHNVAFDRTVLKASLGIDIALERWRCSMCLAYMHSMPGSLDSLCAALEVAQDKRKLKSGKDLVRLFCIPPTEASGRKRATRHTHPEKWQEFLGYAGGDIVAMRECIAKLPKWNLNASELALWQLDRIINERGIAVDLDFCRAAVQAADAEKARLAERASEMTDGAVHAATQRDALLAHLLKAYNVSLPDMQAGTIERRLEDPELPEPVKELLSIRLQASGTSVSKYKAFLRATSSDGRLRGTLQFGGASRTNRWAGRLVQLQNLSRVPKYLKNQYDFAVETIKCGAVELVYENAMDVIGSTVRGALIAAPGKKLCRADLSNIEGRVLAWLAGEDWKLKAFANGDDLYIEGYSRSFGIPVEEVRADEEAGGTMRLIGKVQELACGFQGAVGAFGSMAKLYGVNLEEDRVLEIVRAWRSANPKIVALWYDLEDAAINAVNNAGTTYTCGRLKLRRDGQWLRIRLPSGRVLCYPSPRWEPKKIVDADTGKTVDNPNGGLSYVGLNQYSRRWERLRTYGGRLAENCTQATARDVFAEGLKRCEANGYPVVMHVHDEAICETPDTDEYSGEAVARFLATPPDWAEGLPLAAEGSETKRYRK